MKAKEFQRLISLNESDVLDFKSRPHDIEFRDLTKSERYKKTAAFIKDIISFANTVRPVDSDAHIIYGIEEDKKTGKKIRKGIDIHIDDAEFQAIVKDKVYPNVKFKYEEITFKNKVYGIVTIPVYPYSEPCVVKKEIGGIKPKEVWIRRGTTNDTAYPKEITDISNWLIQVKKRYDSKILKEDWRQDQIKPILKLNRYLEVNANNLEIQAFIKEAQLNKNQFETKFILLNYVQSIRNNLIAEKPSDEKLNKLIQLDHDLFIDYLAEINYEMKRKILFVLSDLIAPDLTSLEKSSVIRLIVKNTSQRYWHEIFDKLVELKSTLKPICYMNINKVQKKMDQQYSYKVGKIPIDLYKAQDRRAVENVKIWISESELKDLRRKIQPVMGKGRTRIIPELQLFASHYATDLPRRTIITKVIPALIDRMFINTKTKGNNGEFGETGFSNYGLDRFYIGIG